MKNSTLLSSLLLGSLMAITLISVYSCYAKEDDMVTAGWVYINETTSTIEIISDPWNSFILEPGESYFTQGSSLGPPNIKPGDYVPPYVAGDRIKVNNNEHTLIKGESVTNIKNYSSIRMGYNHYKFTYIFTDADLTTE